MCWLWWCYLNTRMRESKSLALPLGDTIIFEFYFLFRSLIISLQNTNVKHFLKIIFIFYFLCCFPSVQRYWFPCFAKRNVSVFSNIPQKILWTNRLALTLFHIYPRCLSQSNNNCPLPIILIKVWIDQVSVYCIHPSGDLYIWISPFSNIM